jgi:hypothetical protein
MSLLGEFEPDAARAPNVRREVSLAIRQRGTDSCQWLVDRAPGLLRSRPSTMIAFGIGDATQHVTAV